MSHDCIQIPGFFFFFHASALFHRAREPGVSSSRFLFFLLPPMEITPRTGRSLERNGSSNREHREFSSFSFFFADDGTIIHGDGVKLKVKLITHRYNFDFWNYYYPWTSVSINRGDQESSGSFTVINKRFRMRNVSKKVISLLLARVSYFYTRD